MQNEDPERSLSPTLDADAPESQTSPAGDARAEAIRQFVWQPPKLDPALRPQVFTSFAEDFDVPPDLYDHCEVHVVGNRRGGQDFDFINSGDLRRGSVVFLVGDLARHVAKVCGAFGGYVFETLCAHGRYFNLKLGVEFVALPSLSTDARACEEVHAEVDRYLRMQQAAVQFEPMPGPDGTRLWWSPGCCGGGTLHTASDGTPGLILACADGANATPSAELRAEAIRDLCMALAGLRRYNGRSRINVARHSLLVGELTRRRVAAHTDEPSLALLDPSPWREVLAAFLGAGHDLREATGDGDIATPLTRLISGPARVVRNAAKAACFHLVGATRQHGTVDDLAALFPVIAAVDADASALEYGWSFGCAPVWLKHDERRTAMALTMAKARGKLKRDPSLLDEVAGSRLATILAAADTATTVPALLRETLEDHPFTAAALDVMALA